MKKIKFLTIIAILALLQISCTDSTSGGETLNEKVALYMPDGITPAVDATVKFFSIGDTSATPTYQTQTDAEGRYSVSGITSTGYYNVIADYDDSLYSMQDTVYISQESNQVKDDTLNNPGSISGIVALQPNHSHLLNNVYVMALGMGRAVNVDSTGWFTMTKLAPGDYNFQFDTDIENYGPKFIDITISSNVNDTLSDTITLPYSGVPVVTGIKSSYDTLSGIVYLSWNNSNYGDIANYLIYRKSSDSLNWPDSPVGWTYSEDTIFQDTIFSDPTTDTMSYNLDYCIIIRDNATVDGSKYKYVQTIAVTPLKVTTTIASQSYHIEKKLFSDSASINDSINIIKLVSNPTRTIKRISWAVENIDSIKQVKNFDSLFTINSDTLTYLFDSIGIYQVYSIVEDNAGTFWIDTINISIISDSPVPSALTTTPMVSINDTIILQNSATDVYGSIVKWEWSINNSETFIDIDTNSIYKVIAPPVANGTYSCVLRVTDDDGNIALDTIIINILMDAPIATASTTTPTISINDTMHLIGSATDTYGTISKWEWKIGSTGEWIETSTKDTSVFIPLEPLDVYTCSLRVTDNDGLTDVDQTIIRVMGSVNDIDGNSYNTVKYGNQIWTIDNLRTRHYNDSTEIPNVLTNDDWNNLNTGAYCFYNNDTTFYIIYGALYNWHSVNTGKLAPIGWHVPSDTEWKTLENHLITNGYNYDGSASGNKICKAMASKTYWEPWDIGITIGLPGTNRLTNNSSGFSADAGGCRGKDDNFFGHRQQTWWWSSTAYTTPGVIATEAYSRTIWYHNPSLITDHANSPFNDGYSVRLIKDNE